MEIRRGDIVTVSLRGDAGKPRPALVIQGDLYNLSLASIVLCPLTSELLDVGIVRITLQPSAGNGLKLPSQVMLDKIQPAPRHQIGKRVGRLSRSELRVISQHLRIFLDLDEP